MTTNDKDELLERIVVDLQLQVTERDLDIKALRELIGTMNSTETVTA